MKDKIKFKKDTSTCINGSEVKETQNSRIEREAESR